jgi:hypothetical protein
MKPGKTKTYQIRIMSLKFMKMEKTENEWAARNPFEI